MSPEDLGAFKHKFIGSQCGVYSRWAPDHNPDGSMKDDLPSISANAQGAVTASVANAANAAKAENAVTQNHLDKLVTFNSILRANIAEFELVSDPPGSVVDNVALIAPWA